MYKANSQSKCVASLLALSIAALLPLVNASAESLTVVNNISKRDAAEFSKLVNLVLKNGQNSEFRRNLAPAIGLDKPSPIKILENTFNNKDSSTEFRSCSVVLDELTDKHPKCVYLAWKKVGAGKTETKYYRVSIVGQFEKLVTVSGELDKDGKPVRGSGKSTDQDINSPEVKKAFDAEMAYWLKDWLKKEQKPAAAKKQAAVAKPAAAAAL